MGVFGSSGVNEHLNALSAWDVGRDVASIPEYCTLINTKFEIISNEAHFTFQPCAVMLVADTYMTHNAAFQ